MILRDRDLRLLLDDKIVKVGDKLVVRRVVELSVCRCRECEDRCVRLADPKYYTCVVCNNNHSQKVDGRWVGPCTGERQ